MLAPELIDLIILSAGIWRFAALLVRERGPADVFVGMRRSAGIQHDEGGQPYSWPDTFFGSLFGCVWCLSVWMGIFMAIVYWARPELAVAMMFPFALSAGAIVLESLTREP